MTAREPPRTYIEWVSCLDAIDHNEEIETMVLLAQKGELEWTSGVAERFTARLCGLIDNKLKRAADRIQFSLDRSSVNEMVITLALLDVRRAFQQAYLLASLPVLPEPTKTSVQELVLEAARYMQGSLEESAKRDRSGIMIRLIRNVPVWPMQKTESIAGELPDVHSNGRRVLYHE